MRETEEPQPTAADAAEALLDAVVAITSDLEAHRVLQRLVDSACALTGARYGFLGVVGEDGSFEDSVTHGMPEEVAAGIASLPQGLGILGLLIDEPHPLRLRRIAEHEKSYGFPAGHPPMESFLGVPVRVRGEAFGNLYLTEKQGAEEFTAQDESLVIALAHAAGYVLDNARAYERSERRQVWLEAATRATDLLQPSRALADALPEVAALARETARAERGTFLRPLDQGHELVGDRGGVVAEGLVDQLRAAIEEVERDGEPVRTRSATGRPCLLLPVPSRLSSAGVLLLAWGEGARWPSTDEVDRIRGFVEHVSLSLDRAQALSERHELMLVADRERIARDLHDVVIQRLFATGLQLQGVRRQAVVPEVRDRLADAVADLDTTIRDIRSTIFELEHRRSTSLREGLRDLVKEYVPVLGFTPLVRTTGPLDSTVDEEVGDHLLATLREALSNVARHARAEACAVEVGLLDGWLTLEVTDNGVGLGADLHESGLRNARRRAGDLGGRLRLLPEEPHGTRLEWSVPLPG